MGSRETLEHLYSCFDTMYRVLGASAPSFSDDACVVRTYESARALGEVGLAFRERLGDVDPTPNGAIENVFVQAGGDDHTGALELYCLAMVVGPRVLVSLRDAREYVELDEDDRALLNRASQVLLREMHAVGEVAARRETIEDDAWQQRARDLADQLEITGNAESFGISR
jgi:hypothetical protein